MRHIDADALVERLKHSPLFLGTNLKCKDGVIDLVEKQPALDVVEVVRCKDCKCCEHCYPVKAIGEEALEGWYCKIRKRCMRPDDFCSYGKRKEED